MQFTAKIFDTEVFDIVRLDSNIDAPGGLYVQ